MSLLDQNWPLNPKDGNPLCHITLVWEHTAANFRIPFLFESLFKALVTYIWNDSVTKLYCGLTFKFKLQTGCAWGRGPVQSTVIDWLHLKGISAKITQRPILEPGDHNRFSTFNGLRIPDVTAMFYTQAEARCGPWCCCWELGLKVGRCVSEQGSDAEMSRQGWARAERRWAIMRRLLGFVQVWDSNGGSVNWVKTYVL